MLAMLRTISAYPRRWWYISQHLRHSSSAFGCSHRADIWTHNKKIWWDENLSWICCLINGKKGGGLHLLVELQMWIWWFLECDVSSKCIVLKNSPAIGRFPILLYQLCTQNFDTGRIDCTIHCISKEIFWNFWQLLLRWAIETPIPRCSECHAPVRVSCKSFSCTVWLITISTRDYIHSVILHTFFRWCRWRKVLWPFHGLRPAVAPVSVLWTEAACIWCSISDKVLSTCHSWFFPTNVAKESSSLHTETWAEIDGKGKIKLRNTRQ